MRQRRSKYKTEGGGEGEGCTEMDEMWGNKEGGGGSKDDKESGNGEGEEGRK